MKKRIIHWTDPDYLDAFYKGWGSGQSIPVRKAASEEPKEPKDSYPAARRKKTDPQ